MPKLHLRSDEFLRSWSTIVKRRLAREGLGADQAEAIADDTIAEIRKRFAGKVLYVARAGLGAQQRAAHAYSLHTTQRMRVPDIAERLGITTQYVYQLLKRERNRLSARK